MERTSVKRNYVFLAIMLGAMVARAAVGWFFPVVKDADGTVLEAGATIFKPLGTVFINLMFCIVVPMVFASISSAVANMKSRRRPEKSWASPWPPLLLPAAIAAVIMFVLMRLFPPVLTLGRSSTGEMATTPPCPS